MDKTQIRIQKLLSDMGVASRRAIEEMVIQGRVSVNGQIVNALPCFVDPDSDVIKVDGHPIRISRQTRVYYLLNKPKGTICTEGDTDGRLLASKFVPSQEQRLYCVGGLDEESTGLIIYTNDGKFTRDLTGRNSKIEMVYVADVDGLPTEAILEPLKEGSYIDGKRSGGINVVVTEPNAIRSTVEIKTTESSNKIIRRLLHHLGHKVRRMHRRSLGPVTDHSLKIGRFRPLTIREIRDLLTVCAGAARAAGAARRRAARPGAKGYRGVRSAGPGQGRSTGTSRGASRGAKLPYRPKQKDNDSQ
jgi:23S rRNA pseudouridine2605 synthase